MVGMYNDDHHDLLNSSLVEFIQLNPFLPHDMKSLQI